MIGYVSECDSTPPHPPLSSSCSSRTSHLIFSLVVDVLCLIHLQSDSQYQASWHTRKCHLATSHSLPAGDLLAASHHSRRRSGLLLFWILTLVCLSFFLSSGLYCFHRAYLQPHIVLLLNHSLLSTRGSIRVSKLIRYVVLFCCHVVVLLWTP